MVISKWVSINNLLLSRRSLINGITLLSMTSLTSFFSNTSHAINSFDSESQEANQKEVLIAYYSRSGNTEVIAQQLYRDINADIAFIEPEIPYAKDYLENVEEARQERDNNQIRPIKNSLENIDQYKTIFIGFPVWGGTMPSVIRAFFNNHNFTGKNIVPFITHGKYGVGDCIDVLKKEARGANILKGIHQECDQERDTMNLVDNWLETLGESETVIF